MRIKTLFHPVLAAVLAVAATATAASLQGAPRGAWRLDSARSMLTATAIKNHTKEVPVHFGGLKGWANPEKGEAWLKIPLTTLSTGDAARDANVKTLFFEVDKLAAYANASFKLTKVDADVSRLAQGVPVTAPGHGILRLHGASLPLDGLLTFTRDGQGITVSLDKGWVIAISKTSLTRALVHLDRNCPQPHVVGDKVALSGNLVFLP